MLGLLLVGFDASAHIRGAYIQFVRYEGDDEASNVVDHEELRGNLVGILDTLARILTPTSAPPCGRPAGSARTTSPTTRSPPCASSC